MHSLGEYRPGARAAGAGAAGIFQRTATLESRVGEPTRPGSCSRAGQTPIAARSTKPGSGHRSAKRLAIFPDRGHARKRSKANRQEKNADGEYLYGCFVIDKNWHFATLQGLDYCVSQQYNSTNKNDLLQIVRFAVAIYPAKIKGIDFEPIRR